MDWIIHKNVNQNYSNGHLFIKTNRDNIYKCTGCGCTTTYTPTYDGYYAIHFVIFREIYSVSIEDFSCDDVVIKRVMQS